jgi:hypothetical protein
MIKIYQLHEYSGEYEDFTDRIIGSYLREDRAKEEKIKAETKERKLTEHGNRCINCPFLEEDFSNLNDLLQEYPDYCDKVQLSESDYGIDCENYYSKWDNSTFKIKEVEVEE